MRLVPVLIILVLLAPAAASVPLPRAAIAAAWNPSDAEVMLLVARLDHPGLVPMETPTIAPGDTLPAIIERLAARSGRDAALAEAETFAALDARVATPTLLMLTAIERYWDARDAAMAPLSQEEVARLLELAALGEQASPEFQQGISGANKTLILSAAIMLVDTTERLVVPALQDAARQGAWPTSATADPIGILRLGSTGDDSEGLDRILQIDPQGNDLYTNNAGGTTLTDPLVEGEFNVLTPIAISIDLEGNDWYENDRSGPSIAADALGTGFGLLLDFAGNDHYGGGYDHLGGQRAAGYQAALFRDYEGNDEYYIEDGLGSTAGGFAVARDDAGLDYYLVGVGAGAARGVGDTAVFWDRGGFDIYAIPGGDSVAGWAEPGARGWFVEEGPELDAYDPRLTNDYEFPHGCNDCEWELGEGIASGQPTNGHGNDNRGGLAFLIAERDAFVRVV